MKHVRITPADIVHAKAAAAEAGLCLSSIEKRPDGTVKVEFVPPALGDDWRSTSPLYQASQ